MTKDEKRLQAEKEVLKAMKSGVPIVDLDIFKRVQDLTPSEQALNQISYTEDLYKEYHDMIMSLSSSLRSNYLQILKSEDIINNQVVEKENSFLLALYYKTHPKNAMDEMIRCCNSEITASEFIKIHDKLLDGTSSEDQKGLREDNLKFVGTYVAGQRQIDYFPILEKDIVKALREYLNLINDKKRVQSKEDAFLKPIIYHGLLAALQLFKDGNTRYARLIQHINLWYYTNQTLGYDFSLPTVYATKQYAAGRASYRGLIKSIAITENDDAWNNWIIFNLKCLQNNIWVNQSNIETLKRRKS
uniref:Fic family protein n=1 Tax=Candidatus Ventrenecus sp. TaxID=3085654 RepID=UPI0040277DA3